MKKILINYTCCLYASLYSILTIAWPSTKRVIASLSRASIPRINTSRSHAQLIKPGCYVHLFATADILVSRALKKRVYPTLVTRMHLRFSDRKLFFNFPRKLLSPDENRKFSMYRVEVATVLIFSSDMFYLDLWSFWNR